MTHNRRKERSCISFYCGSALTGLRPSDKAPAQCLKRREDIVAYRAFGSMVGIECMLSLRAMTDSRPSARGRVNSWSQHDPKAPLKALNCSTSCALLCTTRSPHCHQYRMVTVLQAATRYRLRQIDVRVLDHQVQFGESCDSSGACWTRRRALHADTIVEVVLRTSSFGCNEASIVRCLWAPRALHCDGPDRSSAVELVTF